MARLDLVDAKHVLKWSYPMVLKTLLSLFVVLAGSFASTLRADPAASLVPLGSFVAPTYVGVAPGEPELLFVVEQIGRIVVLQNEVKVSQPFLNISDLVLAPGDEQGLFSVAFAPDYQSSGRFYVAFTNKSGDLELNEFRRMGNNPLRAARGTRRILIKIPPPFFKNHFGGQLHFGPDGYLYWSTGDGGVDDPRGENARRLSSLQGKILRINPLPSGNRPYTIPPENPFVGLPGLDEIFAYGLRNPWRFSFDGGRIIIADVGEDNQEEVNFLRIADARGANFGWPAFEGNQPFDPSRPGWDPPTFPMHTYVHSGPCNAVMGGYVVRDPTLTALFGRYLYGDFCTGELRSFVGRVVDQEARDDKPIGLIVPWLTSFGKGFNGTLYVAQRSGPVSRLAPP
jgi:glucose/arabinose dehydrogenase